MAHSLNPDFPALIHHENNRKALQRTAPQLHGVVRLLRFLLA